MAKVVQRFENLEISIGGVMLGCVDGFELTTDTEMNDVTCRASNGWADQEPGEQSWGASATGVLTYYSAGDLTTNYGYEQLMAAKINKTKVQLTWGPDTTGQTSWGGDAYIQSMSLSASKGDKQSYSVSFVGTGPLVPAVNE